MSACTIVSNIILKPGLLWLLLVVLVSGCAKIPSNLEPKIAYSPPERFFNQLPSAFPPLTKEEKKEEWGKELFLGLKFAHEMDLYRAITCYKRALYLAPRDRKAEIEYHIFEAYYIGHKYQEAIEAYEGSELSLQPLSFPGSKEILLMLYDAYQETNQCDRACHIQQLLQRLDAPLEQRVEKYEAVKTADFETLSALSIDDQSVEDLLACYASQEKSISKAKTLNAILPGAGYYYVGQKKTAVTAFIVNALFIYAAYQFFDHGYTAAGLITTSLEMGWYFGGINGAGLAARECNEIVYGTCAKDFLIKERLFPVLMFSFAF